MLRFGLCCQFQNHPIKFVTTTATALARMKQTDALIKLNQLCLQNADSLLAALQLCQKLGIGCFRVNSQILPIKTHPQQSYAIGDLPDGDTIVARFRQCGEFVRRHGLRTCFHPDQFVVLNSPREEVVESSLRELEYQAEVAEWIEADVINIHGGGAYGNKDAALAAFARNLDRLSDRVRSRLTVENDDKIFHPADLLPMCRSVGMPLVYDVHHHRCLPDDLTEQHATELAYNTWNREPLFHLSSPLEGWDGPKPQRHNDYISIHDFPQCWLDRELTVEIEAKAKEIAVLQIMAELKVASN